ncbi:MAG: hypothetical protein AB8G99_01570 [Planctomycetaceae bacterium]
MIDEFDHNCRLVKESNEEGLRARQYVTDADIELEVSQRDRVTLTFESRGREQTGLAHVLLVRRLTDRKQRFAEWYSTTNKPV